MYILDLNKNSNFHPLSKYKAKFWFKLMAISQTELLSILQQFFPKAQIKITDLVGDNDHYSLDITDESFKGMPLIKQHRMVKDALKSVLHQKLHSITIKTRS